MIGLVWNIFLALAWMGLGGNFTGPSFVVGLIVGYFCLVIAQDHIPALNNYGRRVPKVIGFVFFFLWELVKANYEVAMDVGTPGLKVNPGVIAVPVHTTNEVAITVMANFITLTPGTLSLDISDDKSVIYVHAMYLDDEAGLLASLRELEERVVRILS